MATALNVFACVDSTPDRARTHAHFFVERVTFHSAHSVWLKIKKSASSFCAHFRIFQTSQVGVFFSVTHPLSTAALAGGIIIVCVICVGVCTNPEQHID